MGKQIPVKLPASLAEWGSMWRYVGNLGVLQGLGQEDWLGGRETGWGWAGAPFPRARVTAKGELAHVAA